MSILVWVLVSLIVGIVGNTVSSRLGKAGAAGATMLAILGGLIGGGLASLLTGHDLTTGVSLITTAVAFVGALIGLYGYHRIIGPRIA
jgi:uncharacterized membrane protein YeaQ/YmgE (transglycosylase-associated protein family)